jgi:UDP-N-acetyl-D-glucosamine dehydrogenase
VFLNELISIIENRTANIGVIGLGYVGLPLAIAFSKQFNVIGYDINSKSVSQLMNAESYIRDVSNESVKLCLNKSFFPTNNIEDLAKCDFIIICVPTPLTNEKKPDLSYIKSSCNTISRILRKGQFVILESTTYPGTTEEVVLPLLEKSGLKATYDFGLAYSPERIDPGNEKYNVVNTPKVVGGINKECTEIASLLYASIIKQVVDVRDAKTAEAVKIVENIFRNVNIALANELSLVFELMGIDTWAVIDAASTKPYGFMPFYPGPGIGGHCIPLDPFYMSYKAKKYGFIPRFIETSGEINNYMKIHAVNLVEKGLKRADKGLYGSTIAVLGLAYKKNIGDTRESPSIEIIEELINLGAKIKVYDPYAKSIITNAGIFFSETNIANTVSAVDCALFLVDHDEFKSIDLNDLKSLLAHPIVIDCKNVFKEEHGIIYLGLGKDNSN